MSVGLLKGPQKFQIQFLELHVDFSIVGNTELPTSARRRARGEFCIVHNIKVGPSVSLLKGPQKFQIQFLELHVDFSIVDNTELPARARAGHPKSARSPLEVHFSYQASMAIF